jgi:hypothetical protein
LGDFASSLAIPPSTHPTRQFALEDLSCTTGSLRACRVIEIPIVGQEKKQDGLHVQANLNVLALSSNRVQRTWKCDLFRHPGVLDSCRLLCMTLRNALRHLLPYEWLSALGLVLANVKLRRRLRLPPWPPDDWRGFSR